MSKFLSNRLKNLSAYTPGEQPRDRKYIKLNTNESPYPPSPQVIQAVDSAEVSSLNLYPDPTCKALKEKLAARYGVSADRVFVSNGSDDILNFAFMAFCDKEKGMAYCDITYGFYDVFAQLHNVPANIVPLKDDFTVDVEGFLNCGSNVVIANPNAPTGIALPLCEIEKIAKENKESVVIVDEAYVDFGGESAVDLLEDNENILVVRTFSKSRSMAGARLGFAISSQDIIADLELIKYSTNPYDINRLTQIAGVAAIDSDSYYFSNAEKIIETRKHTTEKLRSLGFEVIDSKANFLFARHPKYDGGNLYEELRRRGILVRHFKQKRIDQFLRITIGLPSEMEALCQTLEDILTKEEKKNVESC